MNYKDLKDTDRQDPREIVAMALAHITTIEDWNRNLDYHQRDFFRAQADHAIDAFGTYLLDAITIPAAINASAAAMWEKDYLQQSGEEAPYPWDDPAWEDVGQSEEMANDRVKASAALQAGLKWILSRNEDPDGE